MRIFWSFLIILTAVFLWIIPYSSAAHNFKTDVCKDIFTIITPSGADNATVQLFEPLYNNDTSSVILLSHSVNDAPLLLDYNITSRAATIVGLSDDTTRELDISYDVDALLNNPVYKTIIDEVVPWLWYLLASIFPLAALYAMWFRKRET